MARGNEREKVEKEMTTECKQVMFDLRFLCLKVTGYRGGGGERGEWKFQNVCVDFLFWRF